MRARAARRRSQVVRELGDETLVYDLASHRASCLNQEAGAVFRACNGRRSLAEIATRVSAQLGREIDARYVELAVDRLVQAGLVDAAPGMSQRRRETLRRLAAAAALALPTVATVLAPEPAQAQTCLPNGSTCFMSSACCSGCCGSTSFMCNGGMQMCQ